MTQLIAWLAEIYEHNCLTKAEFKATCARVASKTNSTTQCVMDQALAYHAKNFETRIIPTEQPQTAA